MLYNVLNLLLFIEFFQIYTPCSIVWTIFGLIYDVGNHFERRFDLCFEPFVPILGIMFKLAYRLGFTSIYILHDLMTVSL